MYTISKLAWRFGLSRSTLLYYDRIGLLTPTSGGNGEYRRYSEQDAERLERICTYREAGLRLRDIETVLDSPRSSLVSVLEQRLQELGDEFVRIRRQQKVIVGLLKSDRLPKRFVGMSAQTWTALLEAAGFDSDDMHEWHVEFESEAPDRHQAFLEFLKIPTEEIRAIRTWAQENG